MSTHGTSPASAPGSPRSAGRELITTRYLDLLADAHSPLLEAGVQVRDQLVRQFDNVVDTVVALIDDDVSHPGRADPGGVALSETIGRNRAGSGVHPSQSLHAAALIFEAAYPYVIERASAAGHPSPELTAGVLLNREILMRMAVAARSYVDHLLEKAHTSSRDERRRLSRELHDVAAPAVAVGLHNLELVEFYAATDPERAALKIDAARNALLDALDTIRCLAAESRESVAARGLTSALGWFLDSLPRAVPATLDVRGDLDLLPLPYAEELFLILREATRNAVRHARPQAVRITIRLTDGDLTATVVDDGRGFDVAATLAATSHVGLHSMRERCELLGAELTVTSAPRSGTTVAIRLSLASAPTPALEPVLG